ncbi:MAG: hypothetical protein AAF418_04100 [Pseudomonadota bacterium]
MEHDELEFEGAPLDKLQVWQGVCRLILYSTIAAVIVLLVMAAALV